MKREDISHAINEIQEEYIAEAGNTVSKSKPHRSWVKWGVMAACFCLIVASAIAIPRLMPGTLPTPNPNPGETIDRTDEPDVYPPVEIVPGFELEEPREILTFNYNEASEVLDAARKYIPGYFREELNSEELAALIPDRQAADMAFSGFAGFDGDGTLIDVVLQVDAPFLNGATVTALFSYDELFRCYAVPEVPAVSELNGHDFEVYKWSSDDGSIYYDAFGRINGCSVQISYVSEEANAEQTQIDFEVIADCFTAYRDGKPDLSVIKADTIPEFFDLKLTLSEAQADADFGAYMLETIPSGYAEESIRRYKDQNNDYLSGLWTKGYDELDWRVFHYTEQDANRVTHVDDTENYDLSLYPIPRAQSVPDELRDIVNDPIFIAEELTLDAVYARAYKSGESGDSNGWRMTFSVKYDDIIVRISSKGVEPEWVYEQLMELLDK